MARGKVKWWSNQKGFGFIQQDNGEQDVFVHHADLLGEGYKTLSEGDVVEFDLIKGEKGNRAARVRKVKDSA